MKRNSTNKRLHIILYVSIIVILFLTCLNQSVNALYFYLHNDQPFCLYELLDNTKRATVHYKCPALDSKYRDMLAQKTKQPMDPFKLRATVLDPNDHLIDDRVLESVDGEFTVETGGLPGMFKVCFEAQKSKQLSLHFGKQVEELHVDIHSEHSDGDKLESTSRLTSISQMLRETHDILSDIREGLVTHEKRETRFQQTSNCILNRTFYFGVLQMLTLISLGTWQVFHLKRFFELKKLR